MNKDIIRWLRSEQGVRWSWRRHGGDEPRPWNPPPGTAWRATGPLDARYDPCGAPFLARPAGKRGRP